MGSADINLEKGPLVTTSSCTPNSATAPDAAPDATISAPTETSAHDVNTLEIYKALVGDVDVDSSVGDNLSSLYHTVLKEKRKAGRFYTLSAFAFTLPVTLQIILCLAISIGAHMGLTANQISILAGVNTGVAAGTGVLKGLGLPDKKVAAKRSAPQIVDQIRFTTRKLKAGLSVDVQSEVDSLRQNLQDAEEKAVIALAGLTLPAFKSDTKTT